MQVHEKLNHKLQQRVLPEIGNLIFFFFLKEQLQEGLMADEIRSAGFIYLFFLPPFFFSFFPPPQNQTTKAPEKMQRAAESWPPAH